MAIIRGTTPMLTFRVPSYVSLENISKLYITLKQGLLSIEKTIDQIRIRDNMISCKLTQSETLSLSNDVSAKLQVRILYATGNAIASNVVLSPVNEILKDEVIQ